MAWKVNVLPRSVISGIIVANGTDRAAMMVTSTVIRTAMVAANVIAVRNLSFRPPEISMLE